MKQVIMIVLLSCFVVAAYAASDTTRHAYPSASLGVGVGTAPSPGKSLVTIPVNVTVMLTRHWSLGLQGFVAGRKLSEGYGYMVAKPGLSLSSAGLAGSYRLQFSKRSSVSASMLAGITTASLQDRNESSYVYNGRTFTKRYKTVDKATFFLAQPSLGYSYAFAPGVAAMASLRYDYTMGKAGWVRASDVAGTRADIMLVITPEQIR